MASYACRCPDPRACSCFAQQTPIAPRYYPQYAWPVPPNPGQWASPYQAPNFAVPFNGQAYPQQPFTFQNSFQASYSNPHPVDPSSTFRTALGDTTNTVPTPQPAATKRKQGKTSERNPRKRANNASGPDAPAVFGVGPSSEAASGTSTEPVFHPAFTNIPGVNLGSALDKNDTDGTVASDVWYFMRGVHTRAKLASLLERETLTTKRPEPTEFAYLSCRLCS